MFQSHKRIYKPVYYEGDKCIFYLEYIVTTEDLFALDVYMQNWTSAFITCFYSRHYIEWRQTKFVAFFFKHVL